jgi:nucleotide-binding universal stress UspA family protein
LSKTGFFSFKELIRVETEEAVSLIVIGFHGTNHVEDMLLGSVSERKRIELLSIIL